MLRQRSARSAKMTYFSSFHIAQRDWIFYGRLNLSPPALRQGSPHY
jgi:hypothetical protein